MKKKIFISLFILTAFTLSSCGSRQKKASDTSYSSQQLQSNTVTNLEAAIDGEATASAKYAAYAVKAEAEGLPQIAALFHATTKAEAIHLKNHLAALKDIGVANYKPKIALFKVKTTAENLKEAINGEKYESVSMYPKFFRDAQSDYEDKAEKSFKWAMKAEQTHAKLYAAALANIKNPKELSNVYYLCPTCGGVYVVRPIKECDICGTPSEKFVTFAATR